MAINFGQDNGPIDNLRSHFGGNPEERDPVSRKTHRRECIEFMRYLPDILPANDLPEEVRNSREGQAYSAAETSYHEHLACLKAVLAADNSPHQIAYHIWLCNRAQNRLIRAAEGPAIKEAFGKITGRVGEELKVYETPLPQPPA